MKIKMLDAIPQKQFFGFVIALLIAFLTNVSKLYGNWEEYLMFFSWKLMPAPLWSFILGFTLNSIILVLVVVYGIERPGINKFLTELMYALRDGKLTAEEKLHLIEVSKDEFLSQWVDLTQRIVKQEEEKKESSPEPSLE